MPSPHSSDETQSDARAIAANLGANLIELPISDPMDAYSRALSECFAGTEPGIAEENLQARIRGTLLMALSNKFGWLVLTTGNKSEMAVGYATLYGDMAGGLAAGSRTLKTWVYRLVRDRNERWPRAGAGVRAGATPTAELRPGQLTRTRCRPTRPPRLEAYVEGDLGRADGGRRPPGGGCRRGDPPRRPRQYKRRRAAWHPRQQQGIRPRRLPITNRLRR
jgi:NAD+ synthase (glutamine-hydrolysing)